ncbi:MAG: histidine phosphatase family protein [Alphaproteobacteria bacterium]|nr:histidine phosphatase family protein [Alphaproteobacteria bacterium]
MVKNFYIFRNGQSSYNLAGKLQGQSNDSVLTDKGISQALNAAHFLKDKHIEVIVSSPQRRAKQTGTIIAKQLNTAIRYDSRFAEANLGTADGAVVNKLPKKSRKILNQWFSSDENTNPRFQNGESKKELRQRVTSALKDYVDSPFQNIAVSSHNFSIIEALQSMKIEKKQMDNGEIIHLQYDGNNWKYIQTLN